MSEKRKRGWVVDDKTIVNAETQSRFSGAYEVVIKEAITDFYPSGAEYVQLRVAIPSIPDDEGKPKEYTMDRQVITAGDAKGNAPTFYMGIFQSAFKILNVDNKVAKATARVWSKEEGAFIEEKVDQYVNLIGKKIGAVIHMEREYPTIPIDGYTKEVLSYEEEKTNPYSVRIPQYRDETGEQNRTYSRFTIKRFFSVEKNTYGKTATEMIEGKPAKDIENLKESMKSWSSEPVVMDDSQMNEYILKQLQKNLKKLGEDFDKDRWETYGAGIESGDTPF